MSDDTIQDKLKQLKDAVKQKWGALTDKDLDTFNENLDQLPGLLQARYGHTKEQAEDALAQFRSTMRPEGKDKVEVVRDAFSDTTPEEEAHVKKKVYKE